MGLTYKYLIANCYLILKRYVFSFHSTKKENEI